MQEKEQNISSIKQRILLFAATLGISKRDFYTKIGVSRGTLESRTGITEDVVTKFFATYPEVSIEWVMTGSGEMLNKKEHFATVQEKEQKNNVLEQNDSPENYLVALLREKDTTIREQAEEIGRLKERLAYYEMGKNSNLSVRSDSLATASPQTNALEPAPESV